MFTIHWHVEEHEWARAADYVTAHSYGELDHEFGPFEDSLLLGTIMLRDDDRPYPLVEEPAWTAIMYNDPNRPTHWSVTTSPPQGGFTDGFETSTIELANTFASAFGPKDFWEVRRGDGSVTYQEMEDAFNLLFMAAGSRIAVISNQVPGWKIEFPAQEFRPATERFVSAVANSVAERMPQFAKWRVLQPIMAWR